MIISCLCVDYQPYFDPKKSILVQKVLLLEIDYFDLLDFSENQKIVLYLVSTYTSQI